MTFDYAGSIWDRRCDDNIFELQLASGVTEDLAGELQKVIDMCDELRGIRDDQHDDERDRLHDLASDMRSRFQPAVQTIIDMLQETTQQAKELIGLLDKYSY